MIRKSHRQGDEPVLLFDGDCGFCNAWVRRLMRWDRKGRIRFIPLSSSQGEDVLRSRGFDEERLPNTLIFLLGDQVYYYSEAVRRVFLLLGGGWKVLAFVMLGIPKAFRDRAYKVFAKHRYAWFGKARTCAYDPRTRPHRSSG